MTSASYLDLLKKNRNVRHLWTGHVISEFGGWFSFVAELGLIHMLTASPFATATLLIVRLLPFLLVAPLAGILCDRSSRKRILIYSDILRALTALGFLTVIAGAPVWVIFLCEAINTSLGVFFETAKSAALPNLVTSKELVRANSLMNSTEFLQFSLGVLTGGAVAAQFGYKFVFIFNSLSFVISAAMVARVPATLMHEPTDHSRRATSPESARAGGQKISAPNIEHSVGTAFKSGEMGRPDVTYTPGVTSSFVSELRAGWKYIWTNAFVRAVLLVNIGWASGGGMIILLYDRIGRELPLTARQGLGDENVAALLAAAGIGLFVGMMLAPRAEKWISDPQRAGVFIGCALVGQGLGVVVAALMPSLALICLWIFFSRFLIAIEFGLRGSFLMRVVPDRYRGRVFTTDRSLEMLSTTISTACGGLLLLWLSPRTLMIFSALLSASPGFAWLLALRFTRFRIPPEALR